MHDSSTMQGVIVFAFLWIGGDSGEKITTQKMSIAQKIENGWVDRTPVTTNHHVLDERSKVNDE